jgi:hypothetical protein
MEYSNNSLFCYLTDFINIYSKMPDYRERLYLPSESDFTKLLLKYATTKIDVSSATIKQVISEIQRFEKGLTHSLIWNAPYNDKTNFFSSDKLPSLYSGMNTDMVLYKDIFTNSLGESSDFIFIVNSNLIIAILIECGVWASLKGGRVEAHTVNPMELPYVQQPFFPSPMPYLIPKEGQPFTFDTMSVRDSFAGSILQSLILAESEKGIDFNSDAVQDRLCKLAYRMVDKMLIHRNMPNNTITVTNTTNISNG